jgi:hypothetical protein
MASHNLLRTTTASSYKFGPVKDMGIFLVFGLVKLLEAEAFTSTRREFMPNTNASFAPRMRSEELQALIEKLEALDHRAPVRPDLERFDEEAEALLTRLYGEDHRYVETYKYAILAEAEALVNMPESAQEPMTRDLPKTSLQQRRQALQGMFAEMTEMEAKEVTMLTGDDREDPPNI